MENKNEDKNLKVTFNCDPEVRDLLDRCAKKYGSNRSELIRMAVKAYLKNIV